MLRRLLRRELGVVVVRSARDLFSVVPRRLVLSVDSLTRSHPDLRSAGSVVLGVSRDGNFLVTARAEDEYLGGDDANVANEDVRPSCGFTLHLWDLGCGFSDVSPLRERPSRSVALFGAEGVPAECSGVPARVRVFECERVAVAHARTRERHWLTFLRRSDWTLLFSEVVVCPSSLLISRTGVVFCNSGSDVLAIVPFLGLPLKKPQGGVAGDCVRWLSDEEDGEPHRARVSLDVERLLSKILGEDGLPMLLDYCCEASFVRGDSTLLLALAFSRLLSGKPALYSYLLLFDAVSGSLSLSQCDRGCPLRSPSDVSGPAKSLASRLRDDPSLFLDSPTSSPCVLTSRGSPDGRSLSCIVHPELPLALSKT